LRSVALVAWIMGIVASGSAAVSLWAGASRAGSLQRAGRRLMGNQRAGYRWLAGAAGLWCVGSIAQQVLSGLLGTVAPPLQLADLFPLLALVPAAAGLVVLAGPGADRPGADRPGGDRPGGDGAAGDGPGGNGPGGDGPAGGGKDAQPAPDGPPAAWRAPAPQAWPLRTYLPHIRLRHLADSYALAASLFVIGWIALFGPGYHRSGEGPGTFALALTRPLAGLLVVSAVLPVAAAAGRRMVAPYGALLAIAVGDALGATGRLGGDSQPFAAEQIVKLAGYCLLAATPWLAGAGLRSASPPGRGEDRAPQAARAGPNEASDGPMLPALSGIEPAPVVAALTAGAAAVVLVIGELAGATSADPAVVLAGCTVLLALIARLIGLVRQNGLAFGAAEASGGQFRELADRTSDVVLVCDRDGTIRYVSPSAELHGYQPDDLAGTMLAELVHPDDLAAGNRAVQEILDGGPLARLACRVRGGDGTWRYVEATLSPYRRVGAADKLLVTARDVSDQVELRQQLTHLTFHDGLTGLPNRAYFTERVRDLLGRGNGQVAALFIDLDRFTAVNDSAGHAAGDVLLTQVARRLRTAVTAHDTVARWGSDEFAILAETGTAAKEVVELAERLVQCIADEPFRVAGQEMAVTASVGVSVADRSSGAAAEDVMRNADVAMAQAKTSGGARFEIFAAHMHADVVRRLEISSDLRRAVAAGDLTVEYQPVVELATSRVTGVEALVRWCRGGEQVPPAEFLDIAEESGLIVPLGDGVLHEACRQVAEWRRSSWDIGVSVNFSPRQIGTPWLIDSVASALKSSGLPASALTLEVTERALVGNAGEAVQRLAELRHLGARLAIDDFGTGYASLAYLRHLPVDIIKIDPSFVAGLGTDDTLTLLTRTIVRLGHDLGMAVVAEGIERPQQLDMLREMGCARGQGYLVAPPMAAEGVESLLESGAHRLKRFSPAKAS
jgi:diguanylate cyclase (GGDEF)-like protein/PAS domain S-box-containing protein